MEPLAVKITSIVPEAQGGNSYKKAQNKVFISTPLCFFVWGAHT